MQIKEKNCITAKEYLEGNWNNYKNMSFLEVKKNLLGVCEIPTGRELEQLHTYFRNKKRGYSKKKSNNDHISKTNDNQEGNQDIEIREEENSVYMAEAKDLLQNILVLKRNDKIKYLREEMLINQFSFFKFLKNQKSSPSDDFLEILMNICLDLNDDNFLQTNLFIRICALFNGEDLEVTEKIIQNAIEALTTRENDYKAAYGLLKIVFINEISFKTFDVTSLLKFDQQYQVAFQMFNSFLKQKVDYQVPMCLPNTCFLFCSPMLSYLKEGGSKLHQNMERDYLKFFIQILAYSFEEDLETFKQTIQLFGKLSQTLYGREISINYLLKRIIQEQIEQNQLYFGSLKNQNIIFNQIITLIQNKKLNQIDNIFVEEILSLDQECYQKRDKMAKIIDKDNELEHILQKYENIFNNQNPQLEKIDINIHMKDDPLLKSLLQLMNISQLNYIQLISFTKMVNLFQTQKIFQRYETGIGKTTLSLLFILFVKLQYNIPTISIYQSKELCLRDFLKIQEICFQKNISSAIVLSEDEIQEMQMKDVVFILNDQFSSFSQEYLKQNISQNHLIVMDEFDATIFDKKQEIESLLKYQTSKYLIGFTGSGIEKSEQHLLKTLFKSVFIEYPSSQKINGITNVKISSQLFNTKTELNKRIKDICLQYSEKVPIIIILEDQAIKQFTKYIGKTLLVQDFSIMNPKEIQSFLSNQFLNNLQNKYYTCILNTQQGRGLDIPSNNNIEKNGGVLTIIGANPSNQRELDQFIGRTRRMFNKGQYCIALLAKSLQPCDTYLQTQFDQQKYQQVIDLNKLCENIKTINMIKQKGVPTIPSEILQKSGNIEVIRQNSFNKILIGIQEDKVNDQDNLSEDLQNSNNQGHTKIQETLKNQNIRNQSQQVDIEQVKQNTQTSHDKKEKNVIYDLSNEITKVSLMKNLDQDDYQKINSKDKSSKQLSKRIAKKLLKLKKIQRKEILNNSKKKALDMINELHKEKIINQ